MNAIELLTNQHREVEALFKKMESSGKQSSSAKKQIFQDIQQRLELHTQLEEKLFYPESEEIEEDLVLESYEEHEIVKQLLKKIAKSNPNEPEFMAQIRVLKKIVQHHVEEEEQELFPACEKELGDERLDELGEVLQSEQQKLVDKMTKKKAA